MERLTIRHPSGKTESICCLTLGYSTEGCPAPGKTCKGSQAIEKRLCDYEDTGLTPEEIASALAELAQYKADEKAGLLVRKCVDVGDIIYALETHPGTGQTNVKIRRVRCIEINFGLGEICIQVEGIYYPGGCYCHASDINRTVFLTREAAAAALEKKGEAHD